MTNNIKYSVETIMVSILMILMSVMIVILIYSGANNYKRVLATKDAEENARIALSFINMKIKQNDIANMISVEDKGELGNALVIKYGGEEEGLYSFIYFKDGGLYECYSDGELDEDLSTKIVSISDGKIEQIDDKTISYSLEVSGRKINRKTTIKTSF